MKKYLVWFLVMTIQRSFIHPWKRVAARQLACMLRRPDFGAWFDTTDAAKTVTARLTQLGIDGWDDPAYSVRYAQEGATITTSATVSTADFIRDALRQILGSKEDRTFQPGRYLDSLKRKKKSVTSFVKLHADALKRNRNGQLSRVEGAALLQDLIDTELQPDSAGARFAADCITVLSSESLLRKGEVQATIWKRDPWLDLGSSQDFYSSASLRGNSIMDSLERRTKGMLGPFGYLRNKSISALDFSTSEGRSVRARLAAATVPTTDGGELPVLFVDAVEGRFAIKPALIRQAIEDYAKACGFAVVHYYILPLNRVPKRFVTYLHTTEASVERLPLSYLDATHREYLDAYGLPLEPFEYAYPKGAVTGLCVDLGRGAKRLGSTPSVAQQFTERLLSKGLLWLLVLAMMTCLGYILYRIAPGLLLPTGALFALALGYELFGAKLLRRRIKPAEAPDDV